VGGALAEDHDQSTVLNATANLSTGQLTNNGTDFPTRTMVVLNNQELSISSSTPA